MVDAKVIPVFEPALDATVIRSQGAVRYASNRTGGCAAAIGEYSERAGYGADFRGGRSARSKFGEGGVEAVSESERLRLGAAGVWWLIWIDGSDASNVCDSDIAVRVRAKCKEDTEEISG